MDGLLRRHLWVLDLIAILAGAALAGDATATLIAGALPAPAAARPAAVVHARAPARGLEDTATDGIVARNIFCSACGGAPAAEPSTLPFRLLAIMFAPVPLDELWSTAIVRDEAAGTTGPYGLGAALGDATIVAIEDVRVVLDVGGGRREILELLSPRPGGAPFEPRLPADPSFDGVKKVGEGRYEVRRAFIDHALIGGVVPPWPRVVPGARRGDLVGLMVAGIQGGTPVAAIGLEDGDLLLQANGLSLATLDGALRAVTALRTADHIRVAIERHGRSIRIDYLVR
jgi:hypothetical protein